MAFCYNCKKPLNDDNKFCPYCGKEVKSNSLDVSVYVDVVIQGKPEEYTPVVVRLEHLNRVIEVKIPNIIKDDQKVCLHGLGMVGTDGSKGDLYILPKTISYEYEKAKEHNPERKVSFEGEIRKCPNCGDIIDPYETVCDACGFEIRGRKATSVVYDLAVKLEQTNDTIKKEELIRTFYIPNTKEDIHEFFILAMSNIKMGGLNVEAWMVKLEQAYQKAELSFYGTRDFERLHQLYEQVQVTNKKNSIYKLINKIFKSHYVWGGVIAIVGVVLAIFGKESASIFGMSIFLFGIILLFKDFFPDDVNDDKKKK